MKALRLSFGSSRNWLITDMAGLPAVVLGSGEIVSPHNRPRAASGSGAGAGLPGERGERLLEALLRRLHQPGPDLTGAGHPAGHAGVDLRQPPGAGHLEHVDAGG